MTRAVAALVAASVVVVVAAAVTAGIDRYSAVMLALIVAVGALAVVVARKFAAGSVRPVVCPDCGGMLSPHAPYCKHCGARLDDGG